MVGGGGGGLGDRMGGVMVGRKKATDGGGGGLGWSCRLLQPASSLYLSELKYITSLNI